MENLVPIGTYMLALLVQLGILYMVAHFLSFLGMYYLYIVFWCITVEVIWL